MNSIPGHVQDIAPSEMQLKAFQYQGEEIEIDEKPLRTPIALDFGWSVSKILNGNSFFTFLPSSS